MKIEMKFRKWVYSDFKIEHNFVSKASHYIITNTPICTYLKNTNNFYSELFHFTSSESNIKITLIAFIFKKRVKLCSAPHNNTFITQSYLGF